jgi:hypothetical protein
MTITASVVRVMSLLSPVQKSYSDDLYTSSNKSRRRDKSDKGSDCGISTPKYQNRHGTKSDR